MANLDIRPHDLETVRAILRATLPPDARIWVFGSRAKGVSRRGSDLDLAIDAGRPLTLAETTALNDAFDNSDLPYTVDVVDWALTSEAFRTIIERGRVNLVVGRAPGHSGWRVNGAISRSCRLAWPARPKAPSRSRR
jgi:predicted nucleotidyltransferase